VPDATEKGIAEDFAALVGSIFLTVVPVLAQQVSEHSHPALGPQEKQLHLS
jgi:hypothetical protein